MLERERQKFHSASLGAADVATFQFYQLLNRREASLCDTGIFLKVSQKNATVLKMHSVDFYSKFFHISKYIIGDR